jgi:3-oxoacyl-[acyl-carrier protein] reductase
MRASAWDDVRATNLKGMLCSIQAALPYLKLSPEGGIVLTSSITGPLTGDPRWSHYGVTKAGMVGFMRTAALELAPCTSTINAVFPGNVLTEGVRALGPASLETMAAAIPLKCVGTAAEIGHVGVCFTSEEAGVLTGQTLGVDEGNAAGVAASTGRLTQPSPQRRPLGRGLPLASGVGEG